jgi:C4-dicarboxylate-specific signal transduction histidine kinase
VLLLANRNVWSENFSQLCFEQDWSLLRVNTAIEALSQIHEFQPHLLVVNEYGDDLSLEEIADALRIPRLVQPLALLATTYATELDSEEAIQLGIDELLDKNEPCSELLKMLNTHYRLTELKTKVLQREQEILDTIPNALYVVDVQCKVYRANRAFAGLYGIANFEQLRRQIGKPLDAALAACAAISGASLSSTLLSCLHEATVGFELSELVNDRERFLTGKITPLAQEEDRYLIDLRDTTLEKQSLLREARRERLAKIGNLSIGVAHEIQNPNTFSRVNAENLKQIFAALRPLLLKSSGHEPELKIGTMPLTTVLAKIDAALHGIETASARIGAVLNTLKTYGKSENDASGAIDPKTAIDEAILLTEHLLRNKIDLCLDLPDSLPAVRATTMELSQVFVNLIENARHALAESRSDAPEDSYARIRICVEAETHKELVIAFADNGPGIDEAIQEKIFRPYFTTRGLAEGTGLGLSLSSEIMHRFGGDLSVRSRKGRGATFLVTLQKSNRADLGHGLCT